MPAHENVHKNIFSTTESNTRLQTPHEELEFLRERVRIKEKELENDRSDFETARIAHREIVTYADVSPQQVLTNTFIVSESNILKEKLRLDPEEHDVQMNELLTMVTERGIKNTLSLVSKMSSAHIEDDFHRILVQYVVNGFPTKGVAQGSDLWRALHMVLYEVSLPEQTAEDKKQTPQDLEKLLATMEQFYAGILSVVGSGELSQQEVFTVEIANQEGGEEVIFYVAVPYKRRELFEKHMVATFPNAHLEEMRGDYNIFTYGGFHKGAYGKLKNSPAYPLKEYTDLGHDPLNVVLSSFKQLQAHGEGAAIQFVIGDNGDTYLKQYQQIVGYLRRGEKVKKAIKYGTQPFSEAFDEFKKSFGEALFNSKTEHTEKPVDDIALEMVTKKMKSKIVPVTIRIVASASEEHRAEDILNSLSSTFKQFEEAQGNALLFPSENGKSLRNLLHGFSFRSLNMAHVLPLSLTELATMYHLSSEGISASRELKQSRAKNVAAPIGVGVSATQASLEAPRQAFQAQQPSTPQPAPVTSASISSMPETNTIQPPPVRDLHGTAKSIILGKNSFGGQETLVQYLPEDRMRHFYEIGQTGTGKTGLMKNMIIQDIKNGEGCCYIDPHGSDILDVLAAIPKERYQDVIYFDPAHIETPMGLNMMEFDPERPEQKTFVVNEIFSIFEKLFLAKSPESLGPMFEQYFRNAALLVLEGMPVGTATIADIPRVLANTAFRKECLACSKNPVVNQFWTEIAEKAGGDASLESVVPYITAKTDIFLSNEIMRPILSQAHSAFNFRDIMDSRKILLINLSKGRLGDLNSELLGLIVVGKFLQAALARVDSVAIGKEIADFYLYIDEFQNFTTPSIATILSEARKYRLSLNVAHQFIAQLDDSIRDAVFGNVGTKCVFRVGTEDAEFLEKEFQPEFTANDIIGLDNRVAYVALLVDGKPSHPFNMKTLDFEPANVEQIEYLKQLSYVQYGRPRAEVEDEIAKKYAPVPLQNVDELL